MKVKRVVEVSLHSALNLINGDRCLYLQPIRVEEVGGSLV